MFLINWLFPPPPPTYPYKVDQATSYPFALAGDAAPHTRDAKKIAEKTGNALSYARSLEICRFVAKVTANEPVYVGKKHKVQGIEQSIVIIPTPKGKTAFVSLREKVPVPDGSQGFHLKRIIMISFDKSNRVGQVSEILKMVADFSDKNPQIAEAKRRISIMQMIDGSRYFPTNYAYVQVGTKLYIFQERAKCDLLDFDKTSLTLRQKRTMIRDIVHALLELKRKNIYHRDLKLDNILVFRAGKTWRLKLTDFGLACRRNDDKAMRTLVGTMHCLAPEQVEAYLENSPISYTESQELWSLGLCIRSLFDEYIPDFQAHLLDKAWKKWEASLAKFPPKPQKITDAASLIASLLQQSPEDRLSLESTLTASKGLRK